MGIAAVLGQPDPRVVLVEPVDFAAALGQVEINVAAVHRAAVVVVLFNVGVQIKVGNSLHDGIDPTVVSEHYYLPFVFRVYITARHQYPINPVISDGRKMSTLRTTMMNHAICSAFGFFAGFCSSIINILMPHDTTTASAIKNMIR